MCVIPAPTGTPPTPPTPSTRRYTLQGPQPITSITAYLRPAAASSSSSSLTVRGLDALYGDAGRMSEGLNSSFVGANQRAVVWVPPGTAITRVEVRQDATAAHLMRLFVTYTTTASSSSSSSRGAAASSSSGAGVLSGGRSRSSSTCCLTQQQAASARKRFCV
jgi:hypothetical protein